LVSIKSTALIYLWNARFKSQRETLVQIPKTSHQTA